MKTYNVCFLGTTGYGKSSIINKLFNTDFATNPIVSCTKHLYSVTTTDEAPNGYDAITVFDTPGIGEFSCNDKYQKYYEYAVAQADCIVLTVTLIRTDAPEQRLLLSILPLIKKTAKLIIAINKIDSATAKSSVNYVAWDDENDIPTEQCLKNVEERINNVVIKFRKILPEELKLSVIPIRADRGYGIEELKTQILTIN